MKKIDWPNHIIEFVTVVIGILLAFYLNSWNETRKERNQAEQYLQDIQTEIKDNLVEVEKKLGYHDSLLTQLGQNPEEVVLIIRSSNVKKFAWEIAQNSAFSQHTDYEIHKLLSIIYQLQNELKEHNQNAAELMSYLNIVGPMYLLSANPGNFADNEFRALRNHGWIPIFEDMTTYERELTELYQLALSKMGGEE